MAIVIVDSSLVACWCCAMLTHARCAIASALCQIGIWSVCAMQWNQNDEHYVRPLQCTIALIEHSQRKRCECIDIRNQNHLKFMTVVASSIRALYVQYIYAASFTHVITDCHNGHTESMIKFSACNKNALWAARQCVQCTHYSLNRNNNRINGNWLVMKAKCSNWLTGHECIQRGGMKRKKDWDTQTQTIQWHLFVVCVKEETTMQWYATESILWWKGVGNVNGFLLKYHFCLTSTTASRLTALYSLIVLSRSHLLLSSTSLLFVCILKWSSNIYLKIELFNRLHCIAGRIGRLSDRNDVYDGWLVYLKINSCLW